MVNVLNYPKNMFPYLLLKKKENTKIVMMYEKVIDKNDYDDMSKFYHKIKCCICNNKIWTHIGRSQEEYMPCYYCNQCNNHVFYESINISNYKLPYTISPTMRFYCFIEKNRNESYPKIINNVKVYSAKKKSRNNYAQKWVDLVKILNQELIKKLKN
uniref:Uncharacterized protein n=1 Tax=viral metagenome TaxID=1070528 RepID=A0A6C0ADH6_9ZZZZ